MSHIHFSYPGSCAKRFGVRWLDSAFAFGRHANAKRRQAAALQKPVCDGLESYASLTALLGLLFFSGPVFSEPVQVMVSVLPQKYVVEQIGGEHVAVEVMVGPGKNPATYEPSPRQIVFLSKADIYFFVGVPFEYAWMPRIRKANRKMEVTDMRFGVIVNKMPHEPHGHDHGHGEKGMDPHIWTDPMRLKNMAGVAAVALSALDPDHSEVYQGNYDRLAAALNELDVEIRQTLSPLKHRRFMVFHPAWGYFAERYQMEQIPIEFGGKEPGAQQMSRTINRAKAEGIKKIFIQSQFRSKDARAIARAIGADVVEVDPLAENYMENMRKVANAFARTE